MHIHMPGLGGSEVHGHVYSNGLRVTDSTLVFAQNIYSSPASLYWEREHLNESTSLSLRRGRWRPKVHGLLVFTQ